MHRGLSFESGATRSTRGAQRCPPSFAALAVAVATVSLGGCDELPAAHPAHAQGAGSGSPDAGAPAVAAPDIERLVRASVEAATAHAKTCVIVAPYLGEEGLFDVCPNGGPAVDAVASSAKGLREALGAEAGLGDELAVAELALLFADWVERSTRASREAHLPICLGYPKIGDVDRRCTTRGTLALYQRLARAWNDHRPTEAIAPDPVRKYWAGGYLQKSVDGLVTYDSVDEAWKDWDKRGRLKTIPWHRCPDGPCIHAYGY